MSMVTVGDFLSKYLNVERDYNAVLNALCGDHFRTLRYWGVCNGYWCWTSTMLDWIKNHFDDDAVFRTIRTLQYGNSILVTYILNCETALGTGLSFFIPLEFIDDYSFAECPFRYTHE